MDKLRNLSEAGSGIKGEGQRGGVSSPRSLAESVFPLPTQSEEKIGADRLGDLASLVEFNPESTVAVSLLGLVTICIFHCLYTLIRAHPHTRAQRNGMSSTP
jgi:hypothetical protein